jgi:hypothetical protein
MSSWYDINTRFTGGLERQGLYHSNRKDVQYLLWRYENSLRSRRGRSVEHLSWRQYLQPRDNRSKLSIEHIAAQNNPIAETKVKWEEKDEPEDFGTVAMHRLGNLVLDSISANSSKGKYDFSDKLEGLSKDSTFLSQGELIDWSQPGANQLPEWTIESIKARQKHLIAFSKHTWDPSTYFVPVHAPVAEDDIEDEVQA